MRRAPADVDGQALDILDQRLRTYAFSWTGLGRRCAIYLALYSRPDADMARRILKKTVDNS